MNYKENIVCKEKGCEGQLTIPIKITTQGTNFVVVARCPKCHEGHDFSLPIYDKAKWLPLLTDAFFRCDVCGTRVEKDWYYGTSSPDMAGMFPIFGYHHRGWGMYPYYFRMLVKPNLQIIAKCKKCGKERSKVIPSELFADLTAQAKFPSITFQCPYCNAEIAEDAKTCPTCKKELVCLRCSNPISPNVKFCSFCGGKIKKAPAISEGISGENICPTCHESFKKNSRFCHICGQELICDKCNAPILIGASFCVKCGDPVIKGISRD